MISSPDPVLKSLILTPLDNSTNAFSPAGGGACVPTLTNSCGFVVDEVVSAA